MTSFLTALDNGKICILTLLDLSAAFDTIDHNILLHRLEHTFGISDSALSWFRSYLSDKTQIVTVNGLRSDGLPSVWAFPRAQSWGPFSLSFTRSLFSNLSRNIGFSTTHLPTITSYTKKPSPIKSKQPLKSCKTVSQALNCG